MSIFTSLTRLGASKLPFNNLSLLSQRFSTLKSLKHCNILVLNALADDTSSEKCKKYMEDFGLSLTLLDLHSDPNKRYNDFLHHLKMNQNKYDALYITTADTIDETVLDTLTNNKQSDKCKVISTLSVGTDHINLQKCSECNIKVGHCLDILSATVADFVVGLMLASSRPFLQASNLYKSGKYNPSFFGFCGTDLHSSTVGLVGLGKIGLEVGKRLASFNCRVLYSNRSNKEKSEAKQLGLEHKSFEYILQNSDFIVPLCSLNDTTVNLFTINEFKQMKSNCIFINCSRGNIVNQNDLIYALKNAFILGCGLDVTTPEPLEIDSQLFKMDNAIVLPHVATCTYRTIDRMMMKTAQNIVNVLSGKEDDKYIVKI